jgi:hypothetical protein
VITVGTIDLVDVNLDDDIDRFSDANVKNNKEDRFEDGENNKKKEHRHEY